MNLITRFNLKKDEVEVLGQITREKFDLLKQKKKYGSSLPMNYIVPASVMNKPEKK